MPDLLLRIPFAKIDTEQRMVYGIAAAEEIDRTNEMFDYETSKPEVEAGSKSLAEVTGGVNLGNVRAMHEKADGTFEQVAAGLLKQLVLNDGQKRVEVGAYISDDEDWRKCLDKTYTGFSFGGSYAKRWADPLLKGVIRYTARPTELSLADLPCGPSATIVLVKAAGVTVTEPLARAVAVRTDAGTPTPGGNYADATNKKYPLDTPEHVRAAASYFGMPKNRAKYSAADQKTIDGKIDAATKTFGIGDEAKKMDGLGVLASALAKIDAMAVRDKFVKAVGVDEVDQLLQFRKVGGMMHLAIETTRQAGRPLAKGMYGVGQLAAAIAQIDQITCSAQFEAEAEGDESDIPDDLADIRSQLGDVLVRMAQEEVDELT